jgi:hypothetical protein
MDFYKSSICCFGYNKSDKYNKKFIKYFDKFDRSLTLFKLYKINNPTEPTIEQQLVDLSIITEEQEDLIDEKYISIMRIYNNINIHNFMYEAINNCGLNYDINYDNINKILEVEDKFIEIINTRLIHAYLFKKYSLTMISYKSKAFTRSCIRLMCDFIYYLERIDDKWIFGHNIIFNFMDFRNPKLTKKISHLLQSVTFLAYDIFSTLQPVGLIDLWSDFHDHQGFILRTQQGYNNEQINNCFIEEKFNEILEKLTIVFPIIYKIYTLIYLFIPLICSTINVIDFNEKILLDKHSKINTLSYLRKRKIGCEISFYQTMFINRNIRINESTNYIDQLLSIKLNKIKIYELYNVFISEINHSRDLLFNLKLSDKITMYNYNLIHPISKTPYENEDSIFNINEDLLNVYNNL